MHFCLKIFRKINPLFDYEIVAFDIDPKSIGTAKKGLYPIQDLNNIPKQYKDFLLEGSGKFNGWMTVDSSIKQKIIFQTGSLTNLREFQTASFDLLTCRNVLIYFNEETGGQYCFRHFQNVFSSTGNIILGHSEAILSPTKYKLKSVGNSTYQKESKSKLKSKKKNISCG